MLLALFTNTFTINSEAQNFIDLAGLSPHTHYKTFETEHFTFIYADGYFSFTKRAADNFEHAHTILSPILKWQPRTKTTILIADNEDDANGFTMPPLRVGIALIATPPDAWLSTSYTEDWIKLLVFHEYVHMLNIDPTTEWMEALRYLFGDVVRPNGLWPIWMLEGLAVFYETKTSILGRGRSPYYEGILRAYLNEGKLNTEENFGMTLGRVNGDYPVFPGGETPYLFGYHLWQELALEHPDHDSIVGDYSLRSSHRVPYFINGNLQNLTTQTWEDLWYGFLNRTQTRMGEQIEKIKSAGETKTEILTHSRYSALGGMASNDGQFMAWTETSLEKRQGLVLKNLKTGETKRLDDKIMGVGLGFTPDSNWLIYSALRRYKNFSLFSELFATHTRTGKIIQLTDGLRAKDPHVSIDGKKIVFLKSGKATHALAMADLTYTQENISIKNEHTIYTPKEFSILGTPRFSVNNDSVIFSLQEIGNSFSDLMELKNEKTISKVFHDGAMNRYPYPSTNGIYFVSDKSGVENIYLAASTGNFKPIQVTNVVTGTQMPFTLLPSAAEEVLMGSLLTSNGFEIVKFLQKSSQKSPILEKVLTPSAPESITEAAHSSTALTFPASESDVKNYLPFSSLAPRQWAPVAWLEYSSYTGLFIMGDVLGFDSTGKHSYFADFGYHDKTKTVDGGLTYSYYGFLPRITFGANAYTNDIGIFDFNGSYYHRKIEASLELDYPFRFTYSSITPRVYGFLDWNRTYHLRTQQPVATSEYEFAQPMIPGAGASLDFQNTENSKFGFIPESGIQTSLGAEARFNEGRANGTVIPLWKYLASITSYHQLFEHTVLKPKFRYVATTQHLGTENSSVLLKQGYQTSLNQLGIRGYASALYLARAAAVGSLDFHFPISRLYTGNGTSPAFFKQLHGYVFSEVAHVFSQRRTSLYFPTVGGGAILDATFLIRAPVSLSLDIERGLRSDLGGDSIVKLGISADSFW